MPDTNMDYYCVAPFTFVWIDPEVKRISAEQKKNGDDFTLERLCWIAEYCPMGSPRHKLMKMLAKEYERLVEEARDYMLKMGYMTEKELEMI